LPRPFSSRREFRTYNVDPKPEDASDNLIVNRRMAQTALAKPVCNNFMKSPGSDDEIDPVDFSPDNGLAL